MTRTLPSQWAELFRSPPSIVWVISRPSVRYSRTTVFVPFSSSCVVVIFSCGSLCSMVSTRPLMEFDPRSLLAGFIFQVPVRLGLSAATAAVRKKKLAVTQRAICRRGMIYLLGRTIAHWLVAGIEISCVGLGQGFWQMVGV